MKCAKTHRPSTILVVDDEPVNLKTMQMILQDDYRLLFATGGRQALKIASTQFPDLILLDVLMEDISGYEVCQSLQLNPQTKAIPVIFITSNSSSKDEEKGFEVGVVDYIRKPVVASIVKARVKNHLSLIRIEAIKQANIELIQRLGRAAELKDNETGNHIINMSRYSHTLAKEIAETGEWAEDMLHAAPMHDIGKIGIPDTILNKHGSLNQEEWKVMRKHPEMGAQIIGKQESSILGMAYNIALQHHEKWDGSGYPAGLKGTEITLEARVVALADVFDALTRRRTYKRAWSIAEAMEYIKEQKGHHFDPDLADIFLKLVPDILEEEKDSP